VRSVASPIVKAWTTACLLAVALCTAHGVAHAQSNAPTRQQVQAARDKVKADPNLGGTHKEKTLRFIKKDAEDKPTPREPAPNWLIELARWIAEAGRLVIWALGALAIALLVVGLRHWIRVRAEVAQAKSIKLPSHVRELDIRPESLPDQIGAAARELWRQGDQHGALSLLYRGALSRLVHDHNVPIRAASTEGECVQLASRQLSPGPSAYFGRLVGAWQLTVYGARLPEASAVMALCDDFDDLLGARTPAEVAR
jgi:hypothetical protein